MMVCLKEDSNHDMLGWPTYGMLTCISCHGGVVGKLETCCEIHYTMVHTRECYFFDVYII